MDEGNVWGAVVNFYGCHSNRLVYLNMPKSACTTIRNVMHFLDHGVWPDDPFFVHYPSLIMEKRVVEALIDGPVVFTFVRDPYERVLSGFLNKIAQDPKGHFVKVRNHLKKQHDLKFLPHTVGKDFAKFLYFVSDNLNCKDDIAQDYHWQKQVAIIDNHIDRSRLSFIGSVGRLREHFEKLLHLANIVVDLPDIPKLNTSDHETITWTDEMRGLVSHIYAKDVDLYGELNA